MARSVSLRRLQGIIALNNGAADGARKVFDSIDADLRSGKIFSDVAVAYSHDTKSKDIGGDIG